MRRSLFVTGTDTNVGKTYITMGLIRSLRHLGIDAVGFKPFETGGRSDGESLVEASGGEHRLDEINPVWYPRPLAPLVAAGPNGVGYKDMALVMSAYQKLVRKHQMVIVEGAGGFLVPLSQTLSIGDLAIEWGCEIWIVAPNRLGVLNHTLLSFEAVRSRGGHCSHIVLNDLPTASDEDDLSTEQNYNCLRQCFAGEDQVKVCQFDGDFSLLTRSFES